MEQNEHTVAVGDESRPHRVRTHFFAQSCRFCGQVYTPKRPWQVFCCSCCRFGAARVRHDEALWEQARKHPSLPFSGRAPIARQCSYQGAQDAAGRALSQLQRYLRLLADGPRTDRQAADALGLERTSINARRNLAVNRAWVEAMGSEPGPWGIANTRWGLTDAGREAVEAGA